MKKFRIPKLFGLAILTMITLVAISFIEVAVYSMLIEPGQNQAFYEEHAQLTAPWVSGIGGFVVFFFVVRYWAKRKYDNLLQLVIMYPTAYLILDLVILLTSAEVDWGVFIVTFLLANGAKYAGAFAAYKLTGSRA